MEQSKDTNNSNIQIMLLQELGEQNGAKIQTTPTYKSCGLVKSLIFGPSYFRVSPSPQFGPFYFRLSPSPQFGPFYFRLSPSPQFGPFYFWPPSINNIFSFLFNFIEGFWKHIGPFNFRTPKKSKTFLAPLIFGHPRPKYEFNAFINHVSGICL